MSELSGSAAAQPPAAPSAEPKSAPPSQSGPQGAGTTPADGEPKKLSPAELKKQKQAEKLAKRAQRVQAKGVVAPPQVNPGELSKEGQAHKDDKRPLPILGRPSQTTAATAKDLKKEPKQARQVKKAPGLFFGHLYSQPRQHSLVGSTKDVHPAILALGLQYSSYVICGSTARMVSMLLAFKAVIGSYQTPVGTSLARHLTSHHLSPQIDFLRSCRPLSISMGNSIRWLKDLIIKIDPSTPETEAKHKLLSEIDDYIRDRVELAGECIEEHCVKKIENGDVILTYASSAVVERSILRAHNEGISFSVIVVDSKPLFEGKQLARKLANQGLSVKYFLITGASHAVKQANKVLLGAHAMMSNGRLYSRVGTALVSMLAHAQSLPVIVLCEAVKFTERVALDSIVGNEIAPAEELLSEPERENMFTFKQYLPQGLLAKLAEKDGPGEKKADSREVLTWIDESPNLQMLQVLYDVTPAKYINMVITEYGSLPPTSVPVVYRLSNDKQ